MMTNKPNLIRTIWNRIRKSRTFRRGYYTFSGAPSWSSNDATAFVKEGYGNPICYAVLNAITDAMKEPPPMLFRVKGGSKIEKEFKETYDFKAALSGVSSRPWSKMQIAHRMIAEDAAKHIQKTGCSTFVARQIAVKALVELGELQQILSHPILDILQRPNGYYQTTYSEFVEAYGLSILISGEVFTEPKGISGPEGVPHELYILPVQNVVADQPTEGNPLPGFHFSGRQAHFKYSPDAKETEIFFSKLHDPANPLRGLSPMHAATRSIDLNNEARKYNLEFMKNGGVPSGLVTGEFNAEQAAALHEEHAEKIAGSKNAGKLVLIPGKGMKYEQISVDAAKLLWAETLAITAKEIGAVWNVAPEIFGDPESKTFANYKTARYALYQDTALPLVARMYEHWNTTWVKRFGGDLFLMPDIDQILAIQEDIQKIYERMKTADWLMLNEKRKVTKWEEAEGGNVILLPLNVVPLEVITSAEESVLKELVLELKDQSNGISNLSIKE